MLPMFFIVEEGEIRLGDVRHAIHTSDIFACPPGGPETAHQIANTSKTDLTLLAVSTLLSPEVAEYPDTGRFGVLAEMPPGVDGKPRTLRFVGRAGESLDSWHGQ